MASVFRRIGVDATMDPFAVQDEASASWPEQGQAAWRRCGVDDLSSAFGVDDDLSSGLRRCGVVP